MTLSHGITLTFSYFIRKICAVLVFDLSTQNSLYVSMYCDSDEILSNEDVLPWRCSIMYLCQGGVVYVVKCLKENQSPVAIMEFALARISTAFKLLYH